MTAATPSIPGFIDLQINGFIGVDFSNPNMSPDDMTKACRAILATGTAAFLPTIVTSQVETYRRNLPRLADLVESAEFAGKALGLHIEGPFISPKPGAYGAHRVDWVREPDIDLFNSMLEWSRGHIKILTIAPELPGADKLCEAATAAGVTVSIGHSMATAGDLSRIVESGAKMITHLGNGIPNQINRHHNPIWAGLAEDGLSAGIITDGFHLPFEVMKTFIRAKGIDKTIVVSDASAIAGCEPGSYEIFGSTVVLETNGLLHNPAQDCLAGSSASMMECINHLAAAKLLTAAELLRVGFHNPLAIIGVQADEIARGDSRIVFNSGSGQFEKNGSG